MARLVGAEVWPDVRVQRSPWIDELVDLHPLRHYVLCTLDHVIEVAAEVEPDWEDLGPASAEPPLPAKSRHLWTGEDDDEIDQMADEIQRRQERHDAG